MTFMLAPNFEAPSGDPSRLAAAAAELADVASLLDGVGNQRRFSIADQIGFLSDNRESFVWEGSASTTFGQFIQDRTEGVQQLSGALGRGALALAELAVSIAQVQRAVATVESIGQERAAQASQLPVPVTPNALYGDLYGMVSTYEGIAEAAKDDAATTFRALLEAAPHYVAPEPKPASPPKDNPWWAKAGHAVADVARFRGLPAAGPLIDSAVYKVQGEDELAGISYEQASLEMHLGLGVGGQFPVVGEALDLADAALHLAEGSPGEALGSVSHAIPAYGNVASAHRIIDNVGDLNDARRAADAASDAARRADDVPTSAANGGAGRVPPVAGTGDAGHKWPKHDPKQPDRDIGPIGPTGPSGSPGSGNPTGWTGTPAANPTTDELLAAIRAQADARLDANPRLPRPPADA